MTATRKASESIFVTNKYQKNRVSEDDMLFLALKLCIPQRKEIQYTPQLKNLNKCHELFALNIETLNHSGILYIEASEGRSAEDFLTNLKKKLTSTLKAAHEKVYFIDVLRLPVDPMPAQAVFSAMAPYCFITKDNRAGELTLAFFKRDKHDDREQFVPLTLEMLESEALTQDMYLFMARNNRFLRYLKKGNHLDPNSKARLEKRGVKDLYMRADQALNMQMRSVSEHLTNTVKGFYRIDT